MVSSSWVIESNCILLLTSGTSNCLYISAIQPEFISSAARRTRGWCDRSCYWRGQRGWWAGRPATTKTSCWSWNQYEIHAQQRYVIWKEVAMFMLKILAHPCRPVVTQRALTQRAVALPLVSRQVQCSVLPALAVCYCSLIHCYFLLNGVG